MGLRPPVFTDPGERALPQFSARLELIDLGNSDQLKPKSFPVVFRGRPAAIPLCAGRARRSLCFLRAKLRRRAAARQQECAIAALDQDRAIITHQRRCYDRDQADLMIL